MRGAPNDRSEDPDRVCPALDVSRGARGGAGAAGCGRCAWPVRDRVVVRAPCLQPDGGIRRPRGLVLSVHRRVLHRDGIRYPANRIDRRRARAARVGRCGGVARSGLLGLDRADQRRRRGGRSTDGDDGSDGGDLRPVHRGPVDGRRATVPDWSAGWRVPNQPRRPEPRSGLRYGHR